MLLSFIYFASIMSQAIHPGGEKYTDKMYRLLVDQNEEYLNKFNIGEGMKHENHRRSCKSMCSLSVFITLTLLLKDTQADMFEY